MNKKVLVAEEIMELRNGKKKEERKEEKIAVPRTPTPKKEPPKKKKVAPKKKGDSLTKELLGGKPLLPPNKLEEDRVIIIDKALTEGFAGGYQRELLSLFHQDPKKAITIYIDCPGGSVSLGLAIISVMKMIQAHGTVIRTVCTGMAASMGSHILAAGTKGHRYCHDYAYGVMIHQVSGGMWGKTSDLKVTYEHISAIDEKLARMLSEHTGQPFDKVFNDLQKDLWMTPEQAVNYGIVDNIISSTTMFETVLGGKTEDKKNKK